MNHILRDQCKETLAILAAGWYRAPSGARVKIAAEQAAAIAGTRLHSPEDLMSPPPQQREQGGARISTGVSADKTATVTRKLVEEDDLADVALLNFASAKRPGGGALRGAVAQEEDLVRASGLYPCLESQPRFYAENRACRSPLYTDHVIYSPRVPWVRDDEGRLLERPFLASVISAPAPNAREWLKRHPGAQAEVAEVLRQRAGCVLQVAREHGHRNLVLGAWGCGVFDNDPHLVAGVFASWLRDRRYAGCFHRVVFAVYDPRKGAPTLAAFAQRFAS